MNLTTRITEDRDWEECAALLQDGFLYDAAQRAALPNFWRRMRGAGCLNSAILEDLDRPLGSRILQFGVSAFVTDEFIREAREASSPGLSLAVMELVRRERSPILDVPAIRRANSGQGLNLIVLHFGMTTAGLTPAECQTALIKMPDSFFWLHEGYRLKEIFMEFYLRLIQQFTLGAGFLMRATYEDFTLPGMPLGYCPCRMGITREEALADPGAYVSRLFSYPSPRLFFKPGEQQLLQRALRGETDDEIGQQLNVSQATIKTRWRAIFARAADHLPDLLPGGAEAGGDKPRRGAEKRRLLLRYLLDHPEELRPGHPSGGGQ